MRMVRWSIKCHEHSIIRLIINNPRNMLVDMARLNTRAASSRLTTQQ
jgi:hypothetical protein